MIYWERKVPRTRFHAIHAISEQPGIQVRSTGIGFEDWDENLPIYENLASSIWAHWWPDLIIVYQAQQYFGWEDKRLPPIVTIFNDAWSTQDRLRDIQTPRCRLVIMHHKNEMQAWQERCPDVKFVNLSYPINPKVFKDWGLPKTIDILLTGAIDKTIYPLRWRFAQLIEKAAFMPYHAVHRKHSGYRLDDPESEAINYAKCLNSARICLADTSRYKYAAEKYHEIPACRSVLAGNLPDERQGHFERFMIVIEPDWTDEMIITTIKSQLDEGAFTERATVGYEYVQSRYTVNQYARRFVKAVQDVLK